MIEKFIQFTPNRFVYHLSLSKNRQSILQKGLLPMRFEDSEWRNSNCLYYPSGIFVNNTIDYTNWFYFDEGLRNPMQFEKFDVWRINTNGLNNQWFIDENLSCDGAHLYTQTSIPATNLKLFKLKNASCCYCSCLIYGLPLENCFSNLHKGSRWLHLECARELQYLTTNDVSNKAFVII